MTLDNLFEHGKEMAAKLFSDSGQVLPTWILELATGEQIPLLMPISAMDDKDRLEEMLRKVFIDSKTVRYVSLLEAWALVTKDKEDLAKIDTPISDHPDRTEVVFVMAEDKHHMKSGHYTIMRPANGKPYLSEFKEENAEHAEGRFCNLLAEGVSVN